jgi:ATP-dependent Clp protease ATP-binding subunit ClpB
MTSNIGQELYQKTNSMGFMPKEENKDDFKKLITDSAKKHFKLELLNRIDSVIAYNQLGMKELREILNIDIKKFQKRLKKKGINLKISAQVRVDICERAMEENMGARPLQRIFRDEVQSICAHKILENQGLKEISFRFKNKLIIAS